MSATFRKLLLLLLIVVIAVIVVQAILGFLARIITLVLLGGLVLWLLSLSAPASHD